jgi:glycosyltransferase involved in cell wall biosynthesis
VEGATTIPVTVVIPVKNEAASLPACLDRLAGLAEIVVVDSDSSDGTREIAEKRTTVLNFRWSGGFPKKRNWVLQTYPFKTDWVLFLDADEHLTEPFKAAMATAIQQRDIAGYWLNYRNQFMGRILRHGVRQRKLALFRVGAGAYERIDEARWTSLDMEVHEHPVLDGPVSEIHEPIDHLDDRGIRHFIARHNEYSTWEAERLIALEGAGSAASARLTPRQKRKYRYIEKAWFAPAYFALTYFAKGGFLDGRAGFAYAVLKSMYFFDTRLKIREQRERRTRPAPSFENGADPQVRSLSPETERGS